MKSCDQLFEVLYNPQATILLWDQEHWWVLSRPAGLNYLHSQPVFDLSFQKFNGGFWHWELFDIYWCIVLQLNIVLKVLICFCWKYHGACIAVLHEGLFASSLGTIWRAWFKIFLLSSSDMGFGYGDLVFDSVASQFGSSTGETLSNYGSFKFWMHPIVLHLDSVISWSSQFWSSMVMDLLASGHTSPGCAKSDG